MKLMPKRLWVLPSLLFLLVFAGILKATLPQTTVGSWTSAASLSQARANAAAVMLQDGRILITGGDASGSALQSAELFGTNGVVSNAASMNVTRTRHFSVVLSDGRVLVGGGNSSGGGTTNSAEVYDPAADSWTQLSPMTAARANATAALLQDGRVLVAGGDDNGTPSNTLEVFDPASGSFSFAGALAAARTQHAMAVLQDGRVLIVGGFDGSNALASSEIFDPAAGTVSAGPALASARYAASATTLLDGRVLVIGGAAQGSNGTVDLSSAELFDPVSGTFANAGTNLATAREGHQAFLLPNNNSVLIVGGTSSGQVVAASELVTPQVSPADGSWSYGITATGANVTGRSAATGSAMQQDGLLLAAGGNDASGNALASTELYAFPTVKTDASDYAPGTVVAITGSGWQPGETVNLALVELPLIDTHPTMTAVADGNGNIVNTQFSPDLYDVNVRFWLTAVGSQSGRVAENTFTDSKPNSVTVGIQSPNPVVSGSQVQYIVTIAFNGNNQPCTANLSVSSLLPTGATASFSPGSVTSTGNQTSTLTISTTNATAPGSNNFSVQAAGITSPACNGNNATGTGTLVVVENTTTTLATSLTPSTVGQSITLTATVAKVTGPTTPTGGTVTFLDGANIIGTATLNNGTASINTSALTAGSHGLTASYAGVTNTFAASVSNTVSQTVNAADTTTAVALTTGVNPSVFGQSLIFTATVTAVAPGGGIPAGNVGFYDGGTCASPGAAIATNVALDGSGKASGSGSTLSVSASPHTVLACYSGDSNYNASNGSLAQTVNKANTTAAITSDQPDPSTSSQQVTVKYTVSVTAPGSGTPTGNVQVTDGTDSCTGTVAAGQCNVTLATVGTRTLSATYQGDTNFNASPASAGATHTVLSPATIDVQSPVTASQQGAPTDTIVRAGDSITVTVTLKNNGGSDVVSVSPPSLVVNHTGTASAACGAGSGASQINSGTSHAYTYTCSSVSGDGTLTFTANGTGASGTDATSSQNITGAGGATSNTVVVDDTQPTINLAPASGNVSAPFTFNWSVADPTAGGVSSGVNVSSCTLKIDAAAAIAVPCTSSNSSLTSGTHTVVVAGSDIAGNTNSATRTYTLDSTPPLVTVTFPAIVHGQNGWYNAQDTVPVVGTVTGNDSTTGGSNVTAITCTGAIVGTITGLNTVSASAPVTVSAEGVNSVSCQATDSAGNTGAGGASSNTAIIKIDTQAPTAVTGNASRVPDHNGWYTSALTITFTGTDSTSGLGNCTSIPYSGPDTATGSVNGHCTDNAGNSSSDVPFTFKFDSTPPTALALAVTAGTTGANGWYTTDVTVHTSGTETVSTPLNCTADQFQTIETTGVTFSGSCTNDAGLSANAAPLMIKLDKTGPTAMLAVSAGTLGNNGWYVSDVTVHASGTDSISNPVTCTADQSLTSDSTGHSFSGSCTNDAGLTTNATDLGVKLDKTPPTVIITPDRAADHNGWYNHGLTFTNPGSDSISGIASCTTPAAYSGPDSGNASVNASCTDNAGNVGNGSFNFMYDATPPTNVTGAPNRAADHNGWYNHAVDVVFTGTDSTSGISNCSTITYSGPDTATASVPGHCTDNAGNTSSPDVASSVFKFDSTPPSAAIAVTAGVLGAHGWYTSDVTVTTSGSDSVSNPTTCTSDQYQTSETTGAIFSGSCANDAGLSANAAPLTVKLDKTPPTAVTLTPSGTLGLNGWYTSNVTIQTTGTDTISNPVVCTADQSQTTDTAGQVFHGSCTNDAGLAANAADITIKRDATPPVLVLTFAPDTPDGMNGWWKTPGGVPFSWTCSDATSGVDTTYSGGCPNPLSGMVTANGTTPFSGQVRDQAGNLSVMVTRSLKIDNVAPVVTWNSSGDSCSLPGNVGWCRGTETAAFTASDATSGLSNSSQASFTQSTPTNGAAVMIASGTVMDAAGNVSQGVNAGPYKIDSVAPTITVTTPPAGANYILNASVAANYSCSDGTSGVATCAGPVANGTNLSTNPVGPHTFAVNATDVAGNPAVPVSNSYNVLYSTGACLGDLGHTILQPINYDGSSVFKQKSTVPAKFRVCDANGNSIGTAGVVSSFRLVQTVSGTTVSPVDEAVDSTTPDTMFRWDPTGQQWIFNMNTKSLYANMTYYYTITLNDGSTINFMFGLK